MNVWVTLAYYPVQFIARASTSTVFTYSTREQIMDSFLLRKLAKLSIDGVPIPLISYK